MKNKWKIFKILSKFKGSKIKVIASAARDFPARKFKAFFEVVKKFDAIEDDKGYAVGFESRRLLHGGFQVVGINSMEKEDAEFIAERMNELSREGWGKEDKESWIGEFLD